MSDRRRARPRLSSTATWLLACVVSSSSLVVAQDPGAQDPGAQDPGEGAPLEEVYLYLADGRILGGELKREGGEALEIVVRSGDASENLGVAVSVPLGEILAIERVVSPFVVTEKDPAKLLAAVAHHERLAVEAMAKAGESSLEAATRERVYGDARQGFDRAIECVMRLLELYPERESDVAPRLRSLRSGLSMAHKFSGLTPEEKPGDRPQTPADEDEEDGEDGEDGADGPKSTESDASSDG